MSTVLLHLVLSKSFYCHNGRAIKAGRFYVLKKLYYNAISVLTTRYISWKADYE